jgi:hypothetical protein
MTQIFRRAAEAVVPQKERRGFGREAEMAPAQSYPEIFGLGVFARTARALARRARTL